ncbi:serpin-ZX-like protein, partial [Trifolium pratense]
MDLKKSGRCQEDVALTLTKHLFLKQDSQQKNLVFSPLSLFVVLSVMAAGSEGYALDELLTFLQFDSIHNLMSFFSQLVSPALFSDDRMCFINGMWADESLPLSHSFKQLVATHYNTTLASVDFKTKGDQVCHEVNLWVEKETNGLITKLLHPSMVSKLPTGLVFANAMCFKCVWKHKFMDTAFQHSFHLFNGTKVIAPFM